MRTEIQMLMRADEAREEMYSEYGDHRDEQAYDGERCGFLAGIRLTKRGYTERQIWEFAASDDANYRSWGDDAADAWQSGYTCALYWCADQYDWNADGVPVYNAGNFLGHPEGELM